VRREKNAERDEQRKEKADSSGLGMAGVVLEIQMTGAAMKI
jgi:hypothetical protein